MAVRAISLGNGYLRAPGKGHPDDEGPDGDDMLAGRRPDGGFKMVEATGFEAEHGTS